MSDIIVKLPPFTVDKVYTTLSELVDWGLVMLGIPQQWLTTKGSGIKVAVLDTGVVLNHPDLVGSISAYRNFVNGESIDDLNGHGCISPSDVILTSFCGLQPISAFFDRVSGITHFLEDGATVKDLSRQELKVLSWDQGKMVARKILAAHKLSYSGPIYKVRTRRGDLSLTPWHPVYVMTSTRGKERTIQKLRADRLRVGDRIVAATQPADDLGGVLSLPLRTRWRCRWCNKAARGSKRRQCRGCLKTDWQQGQETTEIQLDNDLAYLAGLVCSDGHIQKDLKYIEFTSDSLELATAFADLCLKLFGRAAFWPSRGTRKAYRVRFNGREEAALMQSIGIPAGNKSRIITIPELITKSPRSVVFAWLAGVIDGDGCTSDNRGRVITGSESFAEQLVLLLWTLGVRASKSLAKPSKTGFDGGGPSWVVRTGYSAELYSQMRFKKLTAGSRPNYKISDSVLSIEKAEYQGYLYDLTVDGTHNYVANGHVVSNTHVCGIVGARKDSTGIVGVAPECSLLVGKVLNGAGEGSDSDVADAIDWAVSQGANIISMSFGTSESSWSIQSAIQRATSDGVICIVAAGNYGPELNTVMYPAMYPECISVGAIGQDRHVADYSSRGARVDIVAPGSNVTSTYLSDGYAKMSGTSMATPFVSGVVALYLSKLKASNQPLLTKAQMLSALIRTATDIELSGKDYAAGYGLINPDQLFYVPSVVNEPRLTARDLTPEGIRKIRLYMSLSNKRLPLTVRVASL